MGNVREVCQPANQSSDSADSSCGHVVSVACLEPQSHLNERSRNETLVGTTRTGMSFLLDEVNQQLACAGGAVRVMDIGRSQDQAAECGAPVKQLSVEEVLIELIQKLERQVALLEVELEGARSTSVESMLGELRMREAILLYVGESTDQFVQSIEEALGSKAALKILQFIFFLDRAPVNPNVRQALREACNHGMSKW